jgi:DNA repair protein RecO (recombination protein O)
MDWQDTGFVLATRRHGESALIVELLTRERGRHAGLVRGGQSPRRRALYQPGNAVAASWRGRLPEHLGTLECELVEAHAARLLDDADRLSALTAATALLSAALPDREPHPDIYESFGALLAALGGGGGGASSALPRGRAGDAALSPPPNPPPSRGRALQSRGADSTDRVASWAPAYVVWECALLAALGFGLDLARCTATGTNQDLAYVSPRTGRAVSREAGAPYRDRLLPLPSFLWRDAEAAPADIVAGLILTRHFLLHHLFEAQGGRLPEARERLLERMRRRATDGIVARSP